MTSCRRCHGRHWVCEKHPRRPWTRRHQRHAPGDACPRCNPAGAVDWARTYAETTNEEGTPMGITLRRPTGSRPRRAMTLNEIDAFVQQARRLGASGSETTTSTATWRGRLRTLSIDIDAAPRTGDA